MSGNEIATIISSAIAGLSIIINIIIFIKKQKTNKSLSSAIAENGCAEIFNKLPNFITEAEQIFGAGTGIAKLAYVLNKVQMECIKLNITYDEEATKKQIETILATPEKKEG